MKLLNEDMFIGLSGSDFVSCLLEFLSKTDTIKPAPQYVTQLIEPYQDDVAKRKEYARNPKMVEIKNDIHKFIKSWVDGIKSRTDVKHVDINPSPYFGLSEYVYVDVAMNNPKLENYYRQNLNRYNRVKFRFTDHVDIEYADKKAEKTVDISNKTFIEASEEMKLTIEEYLRDLHNEERLYLKKMRNRERNKRRRALKRLNAQNKNESIKLQIKESVDLTEGLDEVADGTYCTDYVGDVANWILNKPKPYRILYDKKFDIWCIADAMKNTHKDMSIDMFDDGYVEQAGKNVDKYINFARNDGHFSSGYTDAEVY